MGEFPSLRLRVALWLYALLWVLGLPAVLIYLWRRGRRDAAYSKNLAERFGKYADTAPGAVWVHAVSLGELRSAVPLIRALLGQGEHVVITHFTPAGRRESSRVFASDIATGLVKVVWVPFELGFCFHRFFQAFQPKYGLVMEVEIWPRMIMAARAADVPLFACNAQYPSKSYERDAPIGLRAQLMRGFAGALVKSELQAVRFASVGVRNISVTGELRFDQPIPPTLLAAAEKLRLARPVIVIASAVEGEDEGYISVIKALLDEAKISCKVAPLVIYVPRKPERFDEVAQLLRASGLKVGCRSELFDQNLAPVGLLPQMDVLLGDSLGEMYFYLALATRVVVGGGFTPKGAHNIIEPLALKKPVLVGPQVWTIEYPFAEAEAAGVARKVASFEDLAKALIVPSDPDPAQIDAFFSDHAGATERTLSAIPALLTNR